MNDNESEIRNRGDGVNQGGLIAESVVINPAKNVYICGPSHFSNIPNNVPQGIPIQNQSNLSIPSGNPSNFGVPPQGGPQFGPQGGQQFGPQGGFQVGPQGVLETSTHPGAIVSHLIFKGLAMLSYFILPWFGLQSFTSDLLIIIFSAMDFWVVKNITGRLLVGLRWWNELQENGKEKWMFECRANEELLKKSEANIFWLGQVIPTLVWIAMIVYSFISFRYSSIIPVGFALAATAFNLWAFFKCSRVQKQRLKTIMDDYKRQGVNMAAEMLFRGSVKMPMGMPRI